MKIKIFFPSLLLYINPISFSISLNIISGIIAISVEPKSLIDQFAMEHGMDIEMIGDHFLNNIDNNQKQKRQEIDLKDIILNNIDENLFDRLGDTLQFYLNQEKSSVLRYPTIDFIEDLREEVSRLVPSKELRNGKISYDKMSEYLGMHLRYLRDTRNRILNSNNKKYNPDFQFSKDQLKEFIISLSNNFKEIYGCIEIILKYLDKNELLQYRQQQWNNHNPDLKYDFFKVLDTTIKGYYFGLLLADGFISDGKIGLYLEKEDINVIKRFRIDLGISNKLEQRIDKRKRKLSGEYPECYGVRIGCLPMINDLKELSFLEFKDGFTLQDGFFTNIRQDVALSILLGFYDGDGEEGAPIITSSNRAFLEQIKREFNINYEIKLKKKATTERVWIEKCEIKDNWYLRIGPRIFNRMMKSCDISMERKREYFPMRMGRYAYNFLREKLGDKEILSELTLIGPRIRLAEALGCSFELFKRLCNEYDIKTLPHSFWKKVENKDWNICFDKLIKEFKDKYLDFPL